MEVDIAGELTELPELVGCSRGALVLPNDDDLTYAKLRLDPESMAALAASMGTIDSALTRALCWAAAWDMCRDAELSARDFVALVLAGVGVETDLTAVGSVLAQAQQVIDYYTPAAERPALNAEFVDGLNALLLQAEAGSDHQLALARALATAAESSATVAELQSWLDGLDVPSGLAVDTDLRWHLVTNLARLGAVDAEQIEAELALDPTAQGAERAAACPGGPAERGGQGRGVAAGDRG